MNKIQPINHQLAPNQAQSQNIMASVMGNQEVARMQGKFVMAMQFPRDETFCLEKLEKACSRPSLAERAHYSYPKGGTQVEGPSVHLLRAVARSWGHIDFGWRELDMKEGKGNVPGWTKVDCYAFDIQDNVEDHIQYTIEHSIGTRKGKKVLTDSREIYEHVANQSARRVRAMLQHVIPQDVWDQASEWCNATLKGNQKGTTKDVTKSMIEKFNEYGVTKQHIEDRLGHKIEAVSSAEIVTLGKIFNSIKDGYVPAQEHFITMDVTEQTPQEEPSFDDPIETAPPAQSVKTAAKKKPAAKETDAAPKVKNHAPPAQSEPTPEPEPIPEDVSRDMTKRVGAADEEWGSLVQICQDKGLSQDELSQIANESYGVKTGGLTREQCMELFMTIGQRP